MDLLPTARAPRKSPECHLLPCGRTQWPFRQNMSYLVIEFRQMSFPAKLPLVHVSLFQRDISNCLIPETRGARLRQVLNRNYTAGEKFILKAHVERGEGLKIRVFGEGPPSWSPVVTFLHKLPLCVILWIELQACHPWDVAAFPSPMEFCGRFQCMSAKFYHAERGKCLSHSCSSCADQKSSSLPAGCLLLDSKELGCIESELVLSGSRVEDVARGLHQEPRHAPPKSSNLSTQSLRPRVSLGENHLPAS